MQKSLRAVVAIGAYVIIICLGCAEAAADSGGGDIVVRLRGVGVLTDTSGTTDALGGSATTSDDVVPELDISYFFTKNIAAELILATTRHSVDVKNSAAGNLDLGTVRLLPPVLTLQYHFMPDSAFRPYIGAGINYTIPFDAVKGRSVNSVRYSSEFGYAFQAGIDYYLDKNWALNFDVKKVFVSTDIKVNGGAVNAKNTALDPWLIGLGFGYRF
jgi:outer membrane protein